jgi:hypothetical protein
LGNYPGHIIDRLLVSRPKARLGMFLADVGIAEFLDLADEFFVGHRFSIAAPFPPLEAGTQPNFSVPDEGMAIASVLSSLSAVKARPDNQPDRPYRHFEASA